MTEPLTGDEEWTPERRRALAAQLEALPPAEQVSVLMQTLVRVDHLRDQAHAERDEANAQAARLAAEVDRLDRARMETADDFGAMECRVLELRDERDRARDVAAALEAENAELRALAGRTRKRVRGLIREGSSIGQVAGEVVGLAGEAAEDIDATLARTDPLRADR